MRAEPACCSTARSRFLAMAIVPRFAGRSLSKSSDNKLNVTFGYTCVAHSLTGFVKTSREITVVVLYFLPRV